MKSVMNHRFSDVPSVNVPRSVFDRSHGCKTTFDAGKLIPVFVDEVLPGDTFNVSFNGFARLSTPIYPIMDNMFMETFFFFVPYRLLWSHWQNFMGERKPDPDSSIDYTIPTVNVSNASNMTISDYLGLPTKVTAPYTVSALPFRAYNLIWNDWFRDENLQDSVDVDIDDGPDSLTQYTLLSRGKRHDYFTSCLPWIQKGDTVLLPLGEEAPLDGDIGITGAPVFNTGTGTANLRALNGDVVVNWSSSPSPGANPVTWNSPGLSVSSVVADLSSATSATINEIREAFQIQRLLEKDARSGTRYIEIIKSHFGVNSPDGRLQRAEYLGGGSSPVIITPIARTDSSPGELGSYGIAALKGHGFVKSFVEHGIVIGLVNVRADLTYQEGIERFWSRQTRYDFYWPTLAHLGEQAVLNKEIYIDATTIGAGTDEEVFGYQERFAEYRYKPSRITGKFRSNDTVTLDAWHLGIEFGAQPTLDATFIEDNPPVDRVIATPTEPHFIFDSYIKFFCTRPMPIYSVPGYVDHF